MPLKKETKQIIPGPRSIYTTHDSAIQIRHDFPKKTSKFPKSFMKWNCMSFKGPREMAIIT